MQQETNGDLKNFP